MDFVTHCWCGVCLLRRMGLRGSLFLKLDCNLDERASGPGEGDASPDKLLEELRTGSLSEPHPQKLSLEDSIHMLGKHMYRL